VSRPPLPVRRHTPNPADAMFPSPPGGEGGSSADPNGRSTLTATPRCTPCHLTPTRAESRLAVPDATSLPATPSLAPRGSAPPLGGRVVGATLPAGLHLCDSSSSRNTCLFPTRPPGLTLSETGHHRAHRRQLQQQLAQQQQHLIFSPYMNVACRRDSRPASASTIQQDAKKSR
jgi:hypothetical protein